MIDVKNLNNAIEEFEKEVKSIKTISSVVEDLDIITKKAELNQELQEKGTKGILQIKEDLEKNMGIFNELRVEFKGYSEELNKKLNNQRVLLIVLIAMAIINIALNYV